MDSSQKTLTLRPPAKINLALKVLDRLPSGYHAIWSIMQTVELEDELIITTNSQSQDIILDCPGTTLPQDKENLVFRAAELVRDRAGIQEGLSILLHKRIPMAAGLGGGSSDAASTIMGLNQLWNIGWSPADMAKVGAELGSDIPFFFFAPTALVTGWGQEVIQKRVQGSRWVLLLNPGFPIETKLAYDQLSASRVSVPSLTSKALESERAECWTWDDLLPLIENDFETALFPLYPVLARIKSDLLNAGAEAALLSGSGATMFGIFSSKEKAVQAQSQLAGGPQTLGFLVRSLSSEHDIPLHTFS
jgi:4-diphosphocytidyl-2-C-methyl-D-erythritol kinase